MNNKSLPPKPKKLLSSHLEKKAPLPANPSIASVGLSLEPSKKIPLNKKTWLIILLVFFALVSIVGGIYLVQQKTKIKPKAAPEEVPSCTGETTIRCWGECQPGTCREYEVCEIEGGGFCNNRKISDNSSRCGPNCGGRDDGGGGGIGDCDDGQGGCCDPNNPYKPGCGCNNWEECAVDNGACASGKSCREKECQQNGTSCSENWQCCSGYCTNGICQGEIRTCNSCADCGKEDDLTCTADPNCTNPGQDGFCCKSGSTFYCCYRNCECYEGQQGNCENRGNGKIWLKGGLSVEVYKMTGNGVTCPYSSANRTTVFNGTTAAEGQEFSLSANECGQIEAIGYCGSCKPGCFPIQPTSTPTPIPIPTSTPTPIPPTSTPVPTNTPAPAYSCECSAIKLYNQNWNEIQKENVTAGQTIYISVSGQEDFPTYVIDKGRIRVNKTTWNVGDETQQTVPNHSNEFYISYTVPASGGNIKIEGEIHLTGPETEGHWQ